MAPKLHRLTVLLAALVAFSCKAQAHHDGLLKDLGFPGCVSNCIESSGCSTANVKCMCQASQGTFLSDVVACTYSDCSQAISVDDLLGPLELACGVLGEPIPDSAISSAEAAQSSIDNPKPSTTTVVITATTTAKTTSSGKTTHTAISTSTPTSVETDSVTEISTSSHSTGGGDVSTTTTTTAEDSSSTEVHLSSDTSSLTASSSATTTTTAGPVDPTDSSPFATPINSGGSSEQGSFLGAVVGLAAVLAFGW
ncbi:hypothetical protein SCUP515_07344 [Seiridium cupressi]